MTNKTAKFPSKCDQTTFVKRVVMDNAVHFLKRLAHLNSDGTPPQWVVELQPFRYVLDVLNNMTNVRSAINQCRSLANQAAAPPPSSWLDTIDLTTMSFRQQVLDLFTVVLHSTLDRMLLLTNVVHVLGMTPRNCTLKQVQSALSHKNEALLKALDRLKSAIDPLTDARHSYVHRGEHRRLELFTDLVHLRTILESFKVPIENVVLNEEDADENLLSALRVDMLSVDSAAAGSLEALLDPYESQVEQLGGIQRPTGVEAQRAVQVIAYFGGGKRPDFMG